MRTSTQKTSDILQGRRKFEEGFSLIEILVALLLAATVFLAIPSGDSAQKHRDLRNAIEDVDRSMRFAANEAVLRNTVVRLRLALDKQPVEYVVEYGPPGNLPLPDMPEEKTSKSLADDKAEAEKTAALDRQFTKVPEFEEIKREIHPDVTILGVATTSQKKLIKDKSASIYFFPTGEKDAALVFFSTIEELAWLEAAPFLADTTQSFEPIDTKRRAKIEDVLQSRMDEVQKEWMAK